MSPYRKLVKLILSHDSNLPITPLRKAKNEVKVESKFDVHVTVHCVKFLIIKPTRCTNFSNLFSTRFGQFLCPPSGVFHCTHSIGICDRGYADFLRASCPQTCMTYTNAVCTVKNSWWWTEELSDTCIVSFRNKFEKLVHLVGFIIRDLLPLYIYSWSAQGKICLFIDPNTTKRQFRYSFYREVMLCVTAFKILW